MKKLVLEKDVDTILKSRSWRIISALRKFRNRFLQFSLVSIGKKLDMPPKRDALSISFEVSVNELDRLIFFKENGFIEDWN
jgi:hypothetical protein